MGLETTFVVSWSHGLVPIDLVSTVCECDYDSSVSRQRSLLRRWLQQFDFGSIVKVWLIFWLHFHCATTPSRPTSRPGWYTAA